MMQHLLEHPGSPNLQRHSQIGISTHNLFLFLSCMWAVTTVSADCEAVFFFFFNTNYSFFIGIREVIMYW